MSFPGTLQEKINWSWVLLSGLYVILNFENSLEWIDWWIAVMYDWFIAFSIWYNWPSVITKVRLSSTKQYVTSMFSRTYFNDCSL